MYAVSINKKSNAIIIISVMWRAMNHKRRIIIKKIEFVVVGIFVVIIIKMCEFRLFCFVFGFQDIFISMKNYKRIDCHNMIAMRCLFIYFVFYSIRLSTFFLLIFHLNVSTIEISTFFFLLLLLFIDRIFYFISHSHENIG